MDSVDKLEEMFCAALMATGRKGMDAVVENLRKLGFFDSPASSRHHLAHAGGLVEHSINVWEQAQKLFSVETFPCVAERVNPDSVTIASLLHDVCKAGVYKTEKRNRKNDKGQWEQYDAYVPKYDYAPLGHGEKSVMMLMRWGLELTEDEILAIRWHMANWSMPDTAEYRDSLHAAVEKSPLVPIIIAADQLATWITEVGK